MTRQDLYRKIEEEYADRRAQNEERERQRRRMLYDELPQLEEIEKQIREIGINTAMSVLGNVQDGAEQIAEMERRIAALSQQKRDLVLAAGYPAAYLEPVYTCALCRDTGQCGVKRCECFARRLQELIYENAGLSASAGRDFADFSLTLYDDAKDPQRGLSPRENMQDVLTAVRAFAEGGGDYRHLLFTGPTGLGKTFLSDCVAKQFAQRGKMVFYMSAPSLFDFLSNYHFGKGDASQNDMQMAQLKECELLIIDDLGTEFRNSFTDSRLFELINGRMVAGQPILISTNLNIGELQRAYSERVTSRLIGEFGIMEFFGRDIRMREYL